MKTFSRWLPLVFFCFVVFIWFHTRNECLIIVFVFSLYCSSWDLLCTEPKSFSDKRDLFWSKDVAVCHRYHSHQGVLSAFNIIVAPPSNHHTVCNWACLIKKKNPLLFFYTVNCLWSDAFVFEWKSAEHEASTSLCCWLSQRVLKRSRVPVLRDTAALIADKTVFWGGVGSAIFTLAQFFITL